MAAVSAGQIQLPEDTPEPEDWDEVVDRPSEESDVEAEDLGPCGGGRWVAKCSWAHTFSFLFLPSIGSQVLSIC